MNEIDLKKLTVARLKLMCKERNITGYSKLGKSYIIEKLVNWQRSQAPTGNDSHTLRPQLGAVVNTDATMSEPLAAATDASSPGTTRLVSALPVDLNSSTACANSSAIIVSVAESRDKHECMTTTPTPLYTEYRQNTALISLQASKVDQHSSEKILLTSRKRPLDGEESFRSKKARIDELRPSASLSTSALNVPGLRERDMLPPKRVNYSKTDGSQSNGIPKKLQLSDTPSISLLKAAGSVISTSKPFKALLPVASKNLTNPRNQPSSTNASSEISTNRMLLISSITNLDFSQEKGVELGPITLPPSIIQRKRAVNLALIISEISIQDLTACTQVSRLFRYSGNILLPCII